MVLVELGEFVPSVAVAWTLLKIKRCKTIRMYVENFQISGRVIHIRDCLETFEESQFPGVDNPFYWYRVNRNLQIRAT